LERPGQARTSPPVGAPAGDVAIAELDGPRGRQVEAGQNIDERRLAGAVRPDQTDDLTATQLERDVLKRVDAFE
jgi:hypothetical protein